MRAPNSAGVLSTGLKPIASSRSRISGSAPILTISACSFSTIAGGVPAGITKPVSVSASWPGTPASAMVGTSGMVGERLVAVTARPRSLPSLISPMVGGSAVTADRRLAGEHAVDGEPGAGERHHHEVEAERAA